MILLGVCVYVEVWDQRLSHRASPQGSGRPPGRVGHPVICGFGVPSRPHSEVWAVWDLKWGVPPARGGPCNRGHGRSQVSAVTYLAWNGRVLGLCLRNSSLSFCSVFEVLLCRESAEV